MGDLDMFKEYTNLFNLNPSFQKIYLEQRFELYKNIVKIVQKLGIASFIDIGCAYGLLVDFANANGIDAYGLDFPIENLKKFHCQLKYSDGKFIYGDLQDKNVIDKISDKIGNYSMKIF